MIMGELIRRELEKDHVQYVTVFRNNSGFPVRFVVPREIAPEQIIYYIFEGEKSGASQIHPHERIVSIREVPEKIEHSYQKVEEKMRNDRNGHYLYQKLIESGELTLKEGVDAALIVDPVPSHVGGLVVISRSAGSLLEMSDRQRDEFADLVQLGQTLADVYSGGQPSNSYLRQIFEKGEYREKYPHYRLHARIEPRVNIHAGFERAFGIPVITTETGAIKENLSEIIRVYNL
jgi:galactose-1-phosphate uridylyltransferase